VIWAGIKPQEKIMELQNEIENSLKEFNFKKDFRFHPHITLARVRFVGDNEKLIKNLKNIKIDEKSIEIKDFRLVKSTLKADGPVYEDIAVYGS
jgi:2'-5' RNA ligase